MYDVYGEADKWIKIRCTQTISIVSHLPKRNNLRNDFYRHVVIFFALLYFALLYFELIVLINER